jgi:DNA-binding transcriptional ArsR family regulator
MSQIDEVIHQSVRLKIMSVLWAQRRQEPLEFSQLKKIVGATDGNLGSHLGMLERAGYVQIDKEIVGKKPRTRVLITRAGSKAFRDHVEYLREIVDSASE